MAVGLLELKKAAGPDELPDLLLGEKCSSMRIPHYLDAHNTSRGNLTEGLLYPFPSPKSRAGEKPGKM